MPTKINLPAFLEERLRDATHEPAVRKALQEFGKWFDESKLTFFPDYTNHGIQHIEQVLATVANLIPETAEPAFSKDDAAALILAVLLHDSALHLSKAGFGNLIKGPDQYAHLPFSDRAGWGQTWADFMFLARRWDDAMLANVFGKDDTGAPRAQVRDPFEHWQNLTETDNLLIGEFIRKHHPRLAHEMALYGVPGTTGAYLTLNDLPTQWRDLVGLVARSHGLPLRSGLDYLKKTPHFGTFAHRDYRNVHAVYLMALLRVGDYIQIQGDRTSERVFEYKDIRSLVSQVEHKAHLSDIIITDKTDDPESLQIDAHPQEVAVFLRLKEWLAGIQQELDSSWAVLGEVYGLQPKLKNLGLTFRRVRSNLDDVAEFAKTVPYVPDRIRFDVARAELLKLLIGPLYGNDPSYGVRELMQNSIDAVREYEQYVSENPECAGLLRRNQKTDVAIRLFAFDEATGFAVMVISDRGIGMQEATIRDYFLRAGASYRKSAQWKTSFETDAAAGAKSKVLRSGRFGIGALAAFLIGEEITVKTRHVASSEGYVFKATIDSETVELRKDNELPVGTSIRILVDLKRYNELIKNAGKTTRPAFFDWYRFSKPTISRVLLDARVYQQANNNVHEHFPVEMRGTEWRKLSSNHPYQVYWTYNNGPMLVCNGFFVSNSETLKRISARNHKNKLSKASPFSLPNLLIYDPDGLFPLSLKRDGLREAEYPFELELTRDVLLELIAWVFFQGPSCFELPMKPTVSLYDDRAYFGASAIVMKHSGYAIRLASLLSNHPVSHLVVHPKTEIRIRVNTEAASGTLLFADLLDANDDVRMEMSVRSNKGAKQPTTNVMQIIYNQDFEENSISEVDEINSGGTTKRKHELQVIKQDGPWVTAASKKNHVSKVEVLNWPNKKYTSSFFRDEEYIEYEEGLYLEEQFFPDGCYIKVNSKPWLLDDIWQEFFGTGWIPFVMEERLSKYPEAAKFFREKYPQVVPEAVWQVLGIQKPEGCVQLPLRDPSELEEMAIRAFASNDIPF